ncbi:tail-specific protease precursor [Photobacterium aphoticum]|uniref:Tail-specific protease n=1 Tax=Photobacterium aphoticum TaxID=754436 RepID=A0A090QMV0_9GAMM|nr:tail-specific protease precursor [Photobacterium aphoticum]
MYNYSSILPGLKAKHDARISKDMEFGFIQEDITLYKAEKDINTVSLNEKQRIAEQDKDDADRLARLNRRQKAMGEKPFATLDDVPKDYEAPDAYLDEAVAITADLVSAQS